MSRHRAWTFTQWVTDPIGLVESGTKSEHTEEEHIQNIKDKFEYIIYGREKCPTTGKRHLQGYCYFKNAKTRRAVKKLFNDNTIHLEPAKGSAVSNIKYCSKDQDFWLWAARPIKGNVMISKWPGRR